VTATVGTDDAWLPQWAVAVMVIGLASLLFVLIFGITVVFTDFKNIILRKYQRLNIVSLNFTACKS